MLGVRESVRAPGRADICQLREMRELTASSRKLRAPQGRSFFSPAPDVLESLLPG